MHPLSGALPLPYVPARVTRGALVLICTRLRLHAAELLNTTGPLCPSRCLWNHLDDPVLMVWDWRI